MTSKRDSLTRLSDPPRGTCGQISQTADRSLACMRDAICRLRHVREEGNQTSMSTYWLTGKRM